MTDIALSRLWAEHARTARDARGSLQSRYGVAADLFRRAWTKETVAPQFAGLWTPADPGFGQDDVTAIAFKDMCGGKIALVEVPGYGTHYFNVLPNGEGVSYYDLIRPYMPDPSKIGPARYLEEEDLEALRASAKFRAARTEERLALLKERLTAIMNG